MQEKRGIPGKKESIKSMSNIASSKQNSYMPEMVVSSVITTTTHQLNPANLIQDHFDLQSH